MSYAELEAVRVLKACERFLDNREAYICSLQEPLIQKEMKKRKYVFWGPTLTREEAKEKLGHDMWNKYSLCRVSGSFYESKVLELRDLASVAAKSGGVINVNSDLAYIMLKYWDE